jgi:large subunit ribosomal protein L15
MARLVKRKKVSRMHGKGMGTHGTGARKNKRKSGNKGGIGMSGTGKRADHKKTLVLKLYGNKYFGKQGVTSRKTKRDTRQRINIGEISLSLEKFGKKTAEGFEISLPKYKILGKGEVKEKLIITCFEASKSAIEKVEAAGGKVIVKEKKVIETPLVVNPKHEAKKK